MLKEKIKESEIPSDQMQCKWLNLYFLKDGGSRRGNSIFDTKEQAEAAGEILRQKVTGIIPNSSPRYEGWTFASPDGAFTSFEYSWHMQMPLVQP